MSEEAICLSCRRRRRRSEMAVVLVGSDPRYYCHGAFDTSPTCYQQFVANGGMS